MFEVYHTFTKLSVLDRTLDKALNENRIDPLLFTNRFFITAGSGKSGIKPTGKCTLALYIDRLECIPETGESLIFGIEEIYGCNVQNSEVLELYVGKSNYFFKDPTHRTSSYLWMTALRNVADNMRKSALFGV